MELIQILETNLGKKIKQLNRPRRRRIYLEIDPEDLRQAADFLFNSMKCRFSTATGMDEEKDFEILYHFSLDSKGIFITLRVKTDRKKPEVDTIGDIIKGARWIEREMHELLGVNFKGNEDLRELLLGKDYRGPRHPLRKK